MGGSISEPAPEAATLRAEDDMRLPQAAATLSRLAHMTGDGSVARAVEAKRVVLVSKGPNDDAILEPLRSLAREEKLLGEEVAALAKARGWPLALGNGRYDWSRLGNDGAREALPRLIRIYAREVFELDGEARSTDDEEVRSLVLSVLDGRRSIHGAFTALAPRMTVPGGK